MFTFTLSYMSSADTDVDLRGFQVPPIAPDLHPKWLPSFQPRISGLVHVFRLMACLNLSNMALDVLQSEQKHLQWQGDYLAMGLAWLERTCRRKSSLYSPAVSSNGVPERCPPTIFSNVSSNVSPTYPPTASSNVSFSVLFLISVFCAPYWFHCVLDSLNSTHRKCSI